MRRVAIGPWRAGLLAFLTFGAASASAQILPPGTTPTKLTTGYVFTEGALYDHSGGVYFEDMAISRACAARQKAPALK